MKKEYAAQRKLSKDIDKKVARSKRQENQPSKKRRDNLKKGWFYIKFKNSKA